jgi:alpha-glucosidase
MSHLKTLFVLSCFLYSGDLLATDGWQAITDVSGMQIIPQGVEVAAGQARVRVTAVAPNTIRLHYAPGGQFPTEHSFAVLPGALQSEAVRVTQSADAVSFDSGSVRVKIMRSPFRVVFSDQQGKVISEDTPGNPVAFHGGEFRVWKSMPEDEHYFALGDKSGPLDHRNLAFTMWNTDAFGWQESTDPLYKDIPFFLAMRKGAAYGVFLDNTYRTSFDFGKQSRDSYSFGSDGGELDYYFFYGPDPKRVIEEFTALVGRAPLPPLFALGYQQCRYSYYPESEVREIANKFRKRKIPADVIYLDIDYQQDNRPFTIDRKRFPTFEQMIKDLRAQGFNVIAITDLHIAKYPGYQPYEEGLKGDYFVKNPDGSVYVGKVWPGDSVFPDFTREAARQWWGTLYSDFVRMGIRGFWNDMNEPSIFERTDKTMPLDTVHSVEGRKTDHREIHNVFGMQNARATYEGLLRLQPEVRPFVLTRAAYAGTQRYAATWTGDNSSTWNHMRISIPQLLNLGLSGYSFVGDDIGGFAGSPTPELLTRWMELGVFNPIYRNHGTKGSRNREPWVDGPEHEAIRRQYIEVRYKLLPYIYTGLEESSRTGVPLMRPMFLEYPSEDSLQLMETEFMFGSDLLVAPKVDEKVGPYEVKLPQGLWYDFWTGKTVVGPTQNIDPPLDALPVFVRAGAIIPQAPLVQSTSEVPKGSLELSVYPGSDCHGSLYQDDGNTVAYQRGEFLRMQFTCDSSSDSIKFNFATSQAQYKPWWNTIKATFFGLSRKPQRLQSGKDLMQGWGYDAARGTVSVNLPASPQGEIIITR